MRQAISLAKLAEGRTSPNPMVGAVIVYDNRVIATGWHQAAGTAHAEIVALRQVNMKAIGAAMYVTLEPCCHQGRTGPCCEAIIASGISQVFVGCMDPNPLMNGKGIQRLREAGIHVEVGFCEAEIKKLNEVFWHWITHQEKLPFIICKAASSLDGKIATVTGESQWITSPEARRFTMELRDKYDAILVGINTVLADNPSLTARIAGGRNPVRIIVDSRLRIPVQSRVITDGQAPTIVVTTMLGLARKEKIRILQQANIDIIVAKTDANNHVDLEDAMHHLAEYNITSILVEGGGQIHGSLLANGLIHKYIGILAPKLIGGATAPLAISGPGISQLTQAMQLVDCQYHLEGPDLVVEGRIRLQDGLS